MSLPAHIFIKDLIHDKADGFVDVPPVNKILVVGGIVCYVKEIVAASVPLGVDPIQRKSDNGIDICPHGRTRPCGVNFAAGHILYIIGERYPDIGCSAAGSCKMHRDGIWDDHLAE